MASRYGAEVARREASDDTCLAVAQGVERLGRIYVGQCSPRPQAWVWAVAATNTAITALAKAFSEQGIKDGVQVNSIVPGAVMTERRRSFMEKWAPAHNMSVEEATAKFPLEAGIARYGTPEEIAELMAFLVSPEAHWMTGSTLRMDGGEVKSI